MTVPASQANRYTYTGNGVTTAFAYSSKFLANADLVVVLVNDTTGVETVKTLTTHYTVTGAGTSAGTVTMLTAPATGETLVIYGDPVISQLVDPVNGDGLDVDVAIEAPLDRLTIIARRLKDIVTRTLRQPEGDTADIDRLPAKADRASNFLAFDADGDPIAAAGTTGVPVSAFMETVLDDTSAAAARTTLGFTGAGGTVAIANTASGVLTSFNLVGGYLEWSVSGNALTVAVKANSGSDPSASEPVLYAVRDVTAATAAPAYRTLTAALSITVPNTAVLGTFNSTAFRLWAVLFNDAGTDRIGVINCASLSANAGSGYNVTGIHPLAGWGIASSTAVGAGSDSAATFYTGSAVTSKAYAVAGYATWESGLATAGTWSAAPTREQLWGPGVPLPGQVVQLARTDTGAVATGTTQVPSDDTIPQNTEGDQYLSQAITPTSAANVLKTTAEAWLASSGGPFNMTIAFFRDSTANAIAAGIYTNGGNGYSFSLPLNSSVVSNTTSATTLKLRAGASGAGTTTLNGASSARLMGGVMNSFIEVSEVMA